MHSQVMIKILHDMLHATTPLANKLKYKYVLHQFVRLIEIYGLWILRWKWISKVMNSQNGETYFHTQVCWG